MSYTIDSPPRISCPSTITLTRFLSVSITTLRPPTRPTM
jgi:hypothetical protein